MVATIEERVARLEAAMNKVACNAENNRANLEYISMMTDVDLDEEEEENNEREV